MSTKGGERARASTPWWLGGREACEFCLAFYVLEMETRCASCDRPFCPMCVVEMSVQQAVHCRDCERTEEDHGG